MRFTKVWQKTENANILLKITSVIQLFALVSLTVVILKQNSKKALIISFDESNSPVQMLQTDSNERLESEIKNFLTNKLKHVYSDESVIEDTSLELTLSNKIKNDRENLKKQKVSQNIIIREIKTDKNKALVSSERVLRVGKLKGIYDFPIEIIYQPVRRTKDNLHGLQIVKINELKKEEKKDKEVN